MAAQVAGGRGSRRILVVAVQITDKELAEGDPLNGVLVRWVDRLALQGHGAGLVVRRRLREAVGEAEVLAAIREAADPAAAVTI